MKEKEYQFISKAYDFFDNNFGNVVTFEDIKNDPDSYSSVFCEGSVALRQLLKDLWEHGIETRGCCKGHQGVHTYIKENIFGKQEYIDEKTYLRHSGSKRYHHFISDEHAYIAFIPGELGEAQEICDRIEKKMYEELPELSYATNAFPELITIALAEYVPPKQREEFFNVLSSVLHQDILHSKDNIQQKNPSSKTAPLTEQIQSASSRLSKIPSPKDIEQTKSEHER